MAKITSMKNDKVTLSGKINNIINGEKRPKLNVRANGAVALNLDII